MYTKSAARNIFYAGSLFFLVIFFGLTFNSHQYIRKVSTDNAGITEAVKHGKKIWEDKSCVNCHTILGEGAYFAPELGNVWVRYGGKDDPEGAKEAIAAWMKAQPSGIEGRRQMPQFNLTDEELNDLAEFFRWVSTIDTHGWPPTDAG
ncbi:MAG TPA: cytochrome c [Hellea balneolensis]|uniref:Cytochrome c n=1 Tax=Hellea balneolensis TaxID=287478 RepID=A0A7C5QZF4_9PROT|nr:cytochrome c [Hellea balneolensis]